MKERKMIKLINFIVIYIQYYNVDIAQDNIMTIVASTRTSNSLDLPTDTR